LKRNYFSSHKLPKQQSTSFWSQGILGVNGQKKLQLYLKPLKAQDAIFWHFTWHPRSNRVIHKVKQN
jgi:hypothetical protein